MQKSNSSESSNGNAIPVSGPALELFERYKKTLRTLTTSSMSEREEKKEDGNGNHETDADATAKAPDAAPAIEVEAMDTDDQDVLVVEADTQNDPDLNIYTTEASTSEDEGTPSTASPVKSVVHRIGEPIQLTPSSRSTRYLRREKDEGRTDGLDEKDRR